MTIVASIVVALVVALVVSLVFSIISELATRYSAYREFRKDCRAMLKDYEREMKKLQEEI